MLLIILLIYILFLFESIPACMFESMPAFMHGNIYVCMYGSMPTCISGNYVCKCVFLASMTFQDLNDRCD